MQTSSSLLSSSSVTKQSDSALTLFSNRYSGNICPVDIKLPDPLDFQNFSKNLPIEVACNILARYDTKSFVLEKNQGTLIPQSDVKRDVLVFVCEGGAGILCSTTATNSTCRNFVIFENQIAIIPANHQVTFISKSHNTKVILIYIISLGGLFSFPDTHTTRIMQYMHYILNLVKKKELSDEFFKEVKIHINQYMSKYFCSGLIKDIEEQKAIKRRLEETTTEQKGKEQKMEESNPEKSQENIDK